MTAPQSTLLISDACVLIDYCKADCEDILAIVSKKYLPIRVPRQVLKEVKQLTTEKAEIIGIDVLDVTMEQIREAAVRGGPSHQDRLCFVVARDNAGAVWSNDRSLRKLCQGNDVPVFWGLEILVLLVKDDFISKSRAKEAATSMHAVDRHYITEKIVDMFLKQLKDL